MDRDKAKTVRVELNKALSEVAEKFNLTMRIGNITFNENGFTSKITADELTSEGKNAKQHADWLKASELGLVKREWLGRLVGGYEIIGYDFKKRTRNIIYSKGGKQYTGDTDRLNRDMNLIETKKLMKGWKK